jgi:yeast amino acid transporter
MYLLPIGCYLLTSFLVGFNINFMDPNLFHPFAAWNSTTSHSPFIIALAYTSIRVLPAVLKGCFLFSAYTAGWASRLRLNQLSHTDQGTISNTALFAASRTLFAISQIYGNNLMKNTLGKTNAGHTPIAAILCCSTFGLLAFLGLADRTYNQVSIPISKQALKGLLGR